MAALGAGPPKARQIGIGAREMVRVYSISERASERADGRNKRALRPGPAHLQLPVNYGARSRAAHLFALNRPSSKPARFGLALSPIRSRPTACRHAQSGARLNEPPLRRPLISEQRASSNAISQIGGGRSWRASERAQFVCLIEPERGALAANSFWRPSRPASRRPPLRSIVRKLTPI